MTTKENFELENILSDQTKSPNERLNLIVKFVERTAANHNPEALLEAASYVMCKFAREDCAREINSIKKILIKQIIWNS